jgi:hypothetical protein
MVAGEIKPSVVYEDAKLLAIDDINPQAPLHVLILPKRHIATINDLTPDDDLLVGSMIRVAAALASADIGRCSTAIEKPASRSSTFIFTFSPDAGWRGPQDKRSVGVIQSQHSHWRVTCEQLPPRVVFSSSFPRPRRCNRLRPEGVGPPRPDRRRMSTSPRF